jgi:hypothetical protein
MHPAIRLNSMINFQPVIENVPAKRVITVVIMTESRDKSRDHD